MTTDGTDISAFQPGSPNLGSNAFGFVKATEGVGWVSPVWQQQAQTLRNARDGVGYYHFANGLNTPQAEASYFWNTIRNFWQVGEPCAVDVEGQFFNNTTNPVGWTLAFAQEFKALSGLIVVFYSDWAHIKGPYDWAPLVQFNCGLWGAAYNNSGFGDPSPWPSIFVWQNSDQDESTGGDDDVLYGDLNTWRAYGTPAGLAAQSTTVTPIQEDDLPYSQWSNADKAALYHDIWFGVPGAPLIIDRETGQGAWPETHLASLRQRLDASLGGAVSGIPAAVLSQKVQLPDGSTPTVASILAALLAKPAAATGTTTVTADPSAIATAVLDAYKAQVNK